MKKYIFSILTVAVLFISVFLVHKVWAVASTANHFFAISTASGQYTSLYAVIVNQQTGVANDNTGVPFASVTWTSADVPGTYNTSGEWTFIIPSSTPTGSWKAKIMNRSAAGAEAITDTVLAQVIFDKDNDRGVVDFQQIE